MARFQIGQRVRVVARPVRAEFIGATGTVVGHVQHPTAGLCATLELDDHPLPRGEVWAAPEFTLEPIEDDRTPNAVTSWSRCVWQPAQVAA